MQEPKKKKGIVDFVLLVDATGSMQKCMDAVKASLGAFLAELSGPQSIIHDWRGKVVGYRDFTADSSDWFEDNPFVAMDVAALTAQVANLSASGGDDEPESLLDALHKVVSADQTEVDSQAVDPMKWRSGVTRCVVAFTDATFHATMSYEGAANGTVTDVINVLHAKKVILMAFAPNDACYDELMAADRAQQEKVPGPDFVQGMATLVADKTAFTKTMVIFGKTISQSPPVVLL